MKILYLTTDDPRSFPLLWSGTALSMLNWLGKLGHEVRVEIVGNNGMFPYAWLKWHFYRKVLGQHYVVQQDPAVMWAAKRKLKAQLKDVPFDLVFSWLPWTLLLVETEKPKVFWFDTTYVGTQPLYYPNSSGETYRAALEQDRRIAREAAAAIYSTEWARESAIKEYGADPKRVHAISFGANMAIPAAEVVRRAIDGRLSRGDGTVRLLFVGMDWVRKGGETALAAVREMNRVGTKAKLTVVGCRPELSGADAGMVELLGKLDKNKPEELERMHRLYLESDFFIMTSRGDSSPIVYCEAMGHACPCLAADSGGVGSMIRTGVNGALFEWNDEIAVRIAGYVSEIWGDRERYRQLCLKSLESYQMEFNWEAAAKHLNEILVSVSGQ
jgi:glycosyltransferase involved in cell wall biosynthesis